MTDIVGGEATPEDDLPEVVLSDYGPKRVKTKTMDIEQFDPEKLYRLEQMKARSVPTFCMSKFCQGRTQDEYDQENR